MKFWRLLSWFFVGLMLVLSHWMCVVVAYSYATLLNSPFTSAPASTAFLWFIPFGLGIVAAGVLAWLCHRKAK